MILRSPTLRTQPPIPQPPLSRLEIPVHSPHILLRLCEIGGHVGALGTTHRLLSWLTMREDRVR